MENSRSILKRQLPFPFHGSGAAAAGMDGWMDVNAFALASPDEDRSLRPLSP